MTYPRGRPHDFPRRVGKLKTLRKHRFRDHDETPVLNSFPLVSRTNRYMSLLKYFFVQLGYNCVQNYLRNSLVLKKLIRVG